MSYSSRIERYLLRPMVIEPLFGLEQAIAFYSADSNLPTEIYRRTIEDNKPVIFSSEGVMMAETTIAAADQPVVAQVNLKGTMIAEGGLCTYGIDKVCNEVLQAGGNPNVLGILLNTHSGGGEVVAAQRLSNALSQVSKPIVQYVDGMAASGAYWAGAFCDEVWMGGSTTEVGSIGVVIQMNAEGINYLKENLVSIYADGSENKHDILKAILSGDYDFVKRNSLNPLRNEFAKVVKKGRPNVSGDALTGSMFIGREAIKKGLADNIGTRAEAIKRVVTLSRKRNRSNSARKALAHV